MLRARKGLARQWYTPESQEGEEQPAAFQLEPLTGPDLAEALDGLHKGEGQRSTMGLITAAVKGIKDWRNVADPSKEDKPMPFSTFAIKYLPAEVLFDLGSKVLEISQNTEDDRRD